jgi:hypothetical protein
MHIEELFNRFILVFLGFFLLSLAFKGFFSFHIEFLRVHNHLKEGLGAHIVINLEVADAELRFSFFLYFNDHKFDVLKVQKRELFPS